MAGTGFRSVGVEREDIERPVITFGENFGLGEAADAENGCVGIARAGVAANVVEVLLEFAQAVREEKIMFFSMKPS